MSLVNGTGLEMSAMEVFVVFVNGQSRQTLEGTSISDLLDQLQLVADHVAVEVNLQLVPRERHPTYELRENDHLEIVTLVGGG